MHLKVVINTDQLVHSIDLPVILTLAAHASINLLPDIRNHGSLAKIAVRI